MAIFQVGIPIETAEPKIEVDVNADNPLPIGRHVFSLRVVDDSGNTSAPAEVEVVVLDDQAPTAILRAPRQVPPGQSFVLDGSESADLPPGRIVQFTWTMVE